MLGTVNELRSLVQRSATQRPHLTSRLEKAAFLVLLRPIEKMVGDAWRVGSEDGLRYYVVRRGECDCSDYQRHGRGHPCKHRLALFLHRAMMEDTDRTQELPKPGGRTDGVPRGFMR